MRVTMIVDDATVDWMVQEAETLNRPVAEVMAEHLHRTAQIPLSERKLTLGASALTALEDTLKGGHVQSGVDLVEKVNRLARIGLGDHALRLTAGQLEELAHRAKRQDISLETLIDRIWETFCEQFFMVVVK